MVRGVARMFLGYKKFLFLIVKISVLEKWASSVQFIEKLKWKWKGELSNSKNETFCEIGNKIVWKAFICLLMDTCLIHRLDFRIWIISMQIEESGL